MDNTRADYSTSRLRTGDLVRIVGTNDEVMPIGRVGVIMASRATPRIEAYRVCFTNGAVLWISAGHVKLLAPTLA